VAIPEGARVVVVARKSTHFTKVGTVVRFNASSGGVHVRFDGGGKGERARVLHCYDVEVLPSVRSEATARLQTLREEWYAHVR
jgi:hypothetical protein